MGRHDQAGAVAAVIVSSCAGSGVYLAAAYLLAFILRLLPNRLEKLGQMCTGFGKLLAL